MSINKALLSLARDDTTFIESAPFLFGPESKDYIDQVKAMRSTLLARTLENQAFPLTAGGKYKEWSPEQRPGPPKDSGMEI